MTADDTLDYGKAEVRNAPKKFSNYKVIEELGRGAMGVVYLAETKRGTKVALKVLPPAFVLQEDAVERFTREAKAAAGLDHPNIVKSYNVRLEKGVYFYTMRYIEGRSIAELLDDGPLDPARTCELGAQVADALAYAHSKGVIHRDIKPGNVILTPEDRAMVMDFGIARLQSEATITGTDDLLGTPHYMSPEQAKREKVDERSDIYALGASLYEMATGRKPFAGMELPGILTAVIQDEPPLPTRVHGGVPPTLEAIIVRAMAKRPRHRYQSAEELKEDLEAFESGASTTVKPLGRLKKLSHWRKRHPTFASLVFLLLFGLVVGGGAYTFIEGVKSGRFGGDAGEASGAEGRASPASPESVSRAMEEAEAHLQSGQLVRARETIDPFVRESNRAQALRDRIVGQIQTIAGSTRATLRQAMQRGNVDTVRSSLEELRRYLPDDPTVADAEAWLAERD